MSETLKKQAQKFTQTERTGWILKMTAWEITQVLPPRQPEQLSLFTDTNRPITGRHLDSIERFLTDTPDWAMPSIILAVAPERSARPETPSRSARTNSRSWTGSTASRPSPT